MKQTTLNKPFSQACDNNREAIFEVLSRVFADRNRVLEIGSGTGQHAAAFAPGLPHVNWQTSDLPENHPGINQWIDSVSAPNLLRPLPLDVAESPWPVESIDAAFTANTLHIMSWVHVQGFFSGLGSVLQPGGVLAVYGPFNYKGEYTSPSNARFDQWLRDRDPASGIRDFEAVNQLASAIGLELQEDNEMPANNRLLVWRLSV